VTGDGVSPLGVVQWATGNIGTRSLRAVVEHPGMTLVGLYVFSPEKDGLDAGELCRLDPTGVTATRDVDEVLQLGADCVLYMPRQCDVDAVCRLLESGANIVTTRGEFHHPGGMDPETRHRVEAACERGGTSIHSTGSSPGFITEAVPLVLTSIQRQLDHLVIEEFADLSRRDSPDLLFGLMGFGGDPGSFGESRWSHGVQSFGPSLRSVAEALSLPLDEVVGSGEVAVASRKTEIAAGTLEAGTVAAQRMRSWACGTAVSSSASPPPGTARPSSTRSGTSGPRAGGSPSRVMHHWTSRCDLPSRSRRWARGPRATRPTGP
jgi:4-hydroxy-tetrahydrodipicolinate reductase